MSNPRPNVTETGTVTPATPQAPPARVLAYDVVRVRSIDAFISAMNAKIDEGWQPYGTIVEVVGYGAFQPMVHYEDVL